MIGSSAPAPTRAQKARMDMIKEVGCLVARLRGYDWVYPEIHHLTADGRHGSPRRGHDFTIGLNPWSHRGEILEYYTEDQCLRMFGPSFAKDPNGFREAIGDDEYLLQCQNEMLEAYKRLTSL